MNLKKFAESLTVDERKELVRLLLIETPENRIRVKDWKRLESSRKEFVTA